MLTDPIADMLTRLRNANLAYKKDVSMPSSKLKVSITKILKNEGFIEDFEVQKDGKVKKNLIIKLRYDNNKNRVIRGLERVSKPGLRVYAPSNNLPKVNDGLGIVILSTSSGVLTDSLASKKGVGGEVVAYVW